MIFEVPHTVPTVSLFLETGCLTVGTIIKCCCLNFLHYLVTLEKTEMLYKFFIVQWNTEVKDDWTKEAKKNMLEFGQPQTLEFVGSKSKNVFKNLIKKKTREFEFKSMLEIKNCKSKLKNIFRFQTSGIFGA